MNWWLPHNFDQKRPYLEKRAQIIREVRKFFDDKGFLAVETPILQDMPGADVHINAYAVENDQYLHNSPEFAMKKLLVAGCPKIYQICQVFRKEERTKLHNPEFTMLEWYRAGANYFDLIEDCEALLEPILAVDAPWERLSVSDAFEKCADIKLSDDLAEFKNAAKEQGIRTTDTDQWDDVFHAIMAEKIEPHLGFDRPTFLYDYPARLAALAKINENGFAERFELYVNGIELANAFSELTDAAEQRRRFEADMAEKQRLYGESYPIDEDFLKALEHGLPESAGIALGIDRLIMLVTGADNIKDVLWTD